MFLPVSISVGASGQKQSGYERIVQTSEKFEAIASEAQDMSVPLGQVAADLRTQIEMAFASEGATGATGRWRQLTPKYAAWKRKHAPAAPILVGVRPLNAPRHRSQSTTSGKSTSKTSSGRTRQSYGVSGQMMRQLLVPLTDRTTWHISPTRMLYAPLSDIAGFHQAGTPKMAARPPVDVNLTFLHSIDRTFAIWLNGLMEKSGLAGPGSYALNPG